MLWEDLDRNILYLVLSLTIMLWKYLIDIIACPLIVTNFMFITRFLVEDYFCYLYQEKQSDTDGNEPDTPESSDSEGTNVFKKEKQAERTITFKHEEKPLSLLKYCESFWRFCYHLIMLTLTSQIMWNKPWFWDIDQCWTDLEHQKVSFDIWCYYVTSLSLYLYLILKQFCFPTLKCHWEILHSIINILFISASWYLNFFRIGSLIIFSNDINECLLEAVKMAYYGKYYFLSNSLFGLLFVAWVPIRLGFYPFRIVSHTLNDPIEHLQGLNYYLFNGILIILLLSYLFETYSIIRFTKNSLMKTIRYENILSPAESHSNEGNSKLK